MKNDFKFYAFEQYSIGIRIINFLNVSATNLYAAFLMSIPLFVICLLFLDDLLYSTFGFKYGFLVCIIFFLALWLVLNLVYIFVRKGVYIYPNNTIVIQNGYFANFKFLNFKKFRYSIRIKDIKNIDVDNRFSHINAWESAFFIPNKKDYVILEQIEQYRTIFALEDNFGFVDEVVKRKKQ